MMLSHELTPALSNDDFQWDPSLGECVPFCHPLTIQQWLKGFLTTLTPEEFKDFYAEVKRLNEEAA